MMLLQLSYIKISKLKQGWMIGKGHDHWMGLGWLNRVRILNWCGNDWRGLGYWRGVGMIERDQKYPHTSGISLRARRSWLVALLRVPPTRRDLVPIVPLVWGSWYSASTAAIIIPVIPPYLRSWRKWMVVVAGVDWSSADAKLTFWAWELWAWDDWELIIAMSWSVVRRRGENWSI